MIGAHRGKANPGGTYVMGHQASWMRCERASSCTNWPYRASEANQATLWFGLGGFDPWLLRRLIQYFLSQGSQQAAHDASRSLNLACKRGERYCRRECQKPSFHSLVLACSSHWDSSFCSPQIMASHTLAHPGAGSNIHVRFSSQMREQTYVMI